MPGRGGCEGEGSPLMFLTTTGEMVILLCGRVQKGRPDGQLGSRRGQEGQSARDGRLSFLPRQRAYDPSVHKGGTGRPRGLAPAGFSRSKPHISDRSKGRQEGGRVLRQDGDPWGPRDHRGGEVPLEDLFDVRAGRGAARHRHVLRAHTRPEEGQAVQICAYLQEPRRDNGLLHRSPPLARARDAHRAPSIVHGGSRTQGTTTCKRKGASCATW